MFFKGIKVYLLLSKLIDLPKRNKKIKKGLALQKKILYNKEVIWSYA